jgi:hypothetical protein
MTPFDLTLLLLPSNSVQNAMTGPDTSLAGGAIAATKLLILNYFLADSKIVELRWRDLRFRHLLRLHVLIELFGRQMSQLQRCFFQARAFHMCRVRNLRGLVITNLGSQRRHQH